ncbi:alpha/beta-hydrolase [Ramaria rubella]|nr:alpha/beta-hydrolase [Ramaria rubella]
MRGFSSCSESGVRVTEVSIPVQGASIKVRTYVPESGDDESFPVLVWYHSGGFKLGDLEFDDAFLRLICKTNRVSVVNVDYRLAPEHPFPIPLEDAYDALRWATANASSFSGDVRKGLLVGGPSAGGNLTAVVALRARDDPELKGKLTGQILQIPMICSPPAYPEKWKSELLSMDQNKDAPLLTRDEMTAYYADYNPPDFTSPDVAPLLAQNHRGLPPAYFQVCGLDPLRDEALLYEKILRESGVSTKIECYPGLPHYFWGYIPSLSCSERLREDTLAGVKWLIEKKGE